MFGFTCVEFLSILRTLLMDIPYVRPQKNPVVEAALCWQRATYGQRKARDPCVCKWLCQVESSQFAKYHRQGLRLAGLALFIMTNGLPMTVFPCFINWLDTWFPGEAGETNQSTARTSLSGFGNQWSKLSEGFNNGIWTPNCQLFRSDRTRVISDGISTSSCTPLHCHVVLQEARGGGGLQYNLFRAQPVTARKRPVPTGSTGLACIIY